jgi:sec-independent protein translocase protein TatC
MDFWEHLEELRWTIFKCLIALAVTTTVSLMGTDYVYELLMRPTAELGDSVQIIYKGPTDAFFIQLQMALLGGVVLAAPFCVYFVWGFVAPGLRMRERKAVYFGGGGGLVFFFLGVTFGYFMLSLIFPILARFGREEIRNMWEVRVYISFCLRLLVGAGIAFEMPVVLVILTRLDLVQIDTLRKGRPYAWVIALILSAILTPPDPFTMVALALPLVLLYELSILISKMLPLFGEDSEHDDDGDSGSDLESPPDD